MNIRVAVVDDQALVRGGFAMVLDHQENIEVVAQAGTGLEAIEAARTHRPDVILMDIRMPELDGLEATTRIIAEADWPVRVLILTTFDPDEYVFRALRAGASGFVLKDIPPEELISAVRAVAEGGALLSPSITPASYRSFCQAARFRHRIVVTSGAADRPRTRSADGHCPWFEQHRNLGGAVYRRSNGQISRIERSCQTRTQR